MLKTIKWAYRLGHKHGWNAAVIESRKNSSLLTTNEAKQRRLEDEEFRKIINGE